MGSKSKSSSKSSSSSRSSTTTKTNNLNLQGNKNPVVVSGNQGATSIKQTDHNSVYMGAYVANQANAHMAMTARNANAIVSKANTNMAGLAKNTNAQMASVTKNSVNQASNISIKALDLAENITLSGVDTVLSHVKEQSKENRDIARQAMELAREDSQAAELTKWGMLAAAAILVIPQVMKK